MSAVRSIVCALLAFPTLLLLVLTVLVNPLFVPILVLPLFSTHPSLYLVPLSLARSLALSLHPVLHHPNRLFLIVSVMAPVNVIVTGMPGRPLVNLLVGDVSNGVTAACVTSVISNVLNLHPASYFLVMSGRLLSTDHSASGRAVPIVSPPGESTAFVTLALRHALPGGKGGFGANLKGSAAASRPSSNFDACRDLSGRRVRTVRAERALSHLSRHPHQPASSSSSGAARSSLPTTLNPIYSRKRLRPDDSSPLHQKTSPQNSADSRSSDSSLGNDLATNLVSDKMEDVSRDVTDAVFSAAMNDDTVDTNCISQSASNKRRCVGVSQWTPNPAAMALDGYSSSSSSESSDRAAP